MGGAVDPTYPLFSVASLIAATMLLLVLLNSFIRQSWNLGVIFLCFWLFLEDLTSAIGTIIWSDNADIKLYVYCDIVTHLQLATAIVKPMATLIITRRLYIIASLESVDLASERRREMFIEWTLGLGIPVLVADYVNQIARFEVLEGFGCTNASNGSILSLLIEQSWYIVPTSVSVALYYPRVVRMFYKQRRDVDRFRVLDSKNSVSRLNYLRVLALASIDIVLTLPFGIVSVVLTVTSALDQPGAFNFYPGWTAIHSNWAPGYITCAELKGFGTASLALQYFIFWTGPVLSFVIFGLFGMTTEARASYWRVICTIGDWFGWHPTPRAERVRSQLGTMEFGARPQEAISFDAEMGYVYVFLLISFRH
ncbi:fungal pheromone STE3G-protein-coupled receptor [Peniophora sp. CONT]|nr:fungal pheromone STE3G-protein-coupled receptor [Peniophora sp. CONT]